MKKIATVILFLAALKCNAQDSTKIKGLQLQSRVIEYIISNCMNPDNDSLYQVYIDLRPKYRIANPPSGATLVTIDSIPTVELSNLYFYVLSNSDGMGMGNLVKTGLATVRVSNSYLDRLCTNSETYWADRLATLRTAGRKLLRGK